MTTARVFFSTMIAVVLASIIDDLLTKFLPHSSVYECAGSEQSGEFMYLILISAIAAGVFAAINYAYKHL